MKPTVTMFAEHDANEVRFGLMSDGRIVYNEFGPPYSVAVWPRYTENNYIFGSGLWIGFIVDVDGDGVKDTVSVQSYIPQNAHTEFAPGRVLDDPEDPLSRLFMSTNPEDLLEWPDEFRDQSGDPIVHSLQDIVGIYNDLTGEPQYPNTNVGVQVQQRSLAFMEGSTAKAIIFVWDIMNMTEFTPLGPRSFEDAYVGIDTDAYAGPEFSDDLTSYFTHQRTSRGDDLPVQLGFAWDSDFYENDFDGTPGFVGVTFLQTPGDDDDGIDNDNDGMVDESPANGLDDDGDGEVDEWDEVDELGMVNYSYHSFDNFPRDPYGDQDVYEMLACSPPDACGECVWEDDVRFMISSGPFEWIPGSTVRVAAAYLFARPVGEPTHIERTGDPPRPDPNDPVFADLIANTLNVKSFYDEGFPDSLHYLHIYGTTEHPLTNDITDSLDIGTFMYSSRGIADAALFYSHDGGVSYSRTDLDDVGEKRFSGKLPLPDTWWTEVPYFIQAVDSAYRVTRDPDGAPERVFSARTIPAPVLFPPDSVTGIPYPDWYFLTWIDYDKDGDHDAYFYKRNGAMKFMRNDGGRVFVDVTLESGTLFSGYEIASAGDFDNDGFDDLALGYPFGKMTTLLLHNRGDGTFEDVSEQTGVADSIRTNDVAWNDVNGDGFLDLYLTRESTYSQSSYLYVNQGGWSFTEEAGSRGLPIADTYIKDILFFDADRDHDDDLLLVTYSSVLFYSNHRGMFTDRTGEAGIDLRAWRAEALDIDTDGDFDVVLTPSDGGFAVYENDGTGHFTDITGQLGFTGWIEGALVFTGDVNADGLPDIFNSGDRSYLHLLRPVGTCIDAARLYGGLDNPSSISMVDADLNGTLDLLKEGLHLSAGIPGGYENKSIQVDLEGTLSNRSAIGAVASLFVGDRALTDYVRGTPPHPRRLYFGTGQDNPDSLIISWPSGIIQTERDLVANSIISVTEDSTLSGIGNEKPAGRLPRQFSLSQNYPNPFNPQTTIRYSVPEQDEPVRVHVAVYDLRGKLVKILVNEPQPPGNYTVMWDGKDGQRLQAASGVYLVRMRAGSFESTRKILLVR